MRGFATRLSAFILLLVLLQFSASVVFPAEIPSEILRLDDYLRDKVDILYFGDSTLSYPVGEVTTGEILQEMLPGYTVGEISHPAYGMDLYLRYVEYIVRSDHRPHTVILPINMRSFSPEWDMRPGYQFEKEKKVLTLGLFLSRILFRPLKVFGAFEPDITQDMFLGTTVYHGDTPVGTVREFENLSDEAVAAELQGDAGFVYHDALPSEDDKEALQKALIYYYMHSLEKEHRKLRAMLEIVEICRQSDVNLILYITSVNYQQGERVLGSAFSERLGENMGVVKSLLGVDDTTDVTLLDLCFGLQAYAFVDMEHLTEQGKTHVAEQLAKTIQPELLVAPSDTGGEAVSVIPTLEPALPEAAVPNVSTDPLPPPTIAETVLTAAETQGPTRLAVAVADATATLAKPLPRATVRDPASIATRTPTSTPIATATINSTPTPTASVPYEMVDDDIRSGTVTEARHVAHLQPSGKYSVDMYRLRYQSLDEKQQLVEVRADVYIPRVQVATLFPILGHAPGTTGIGDGCAPLDEQAKQRNWGNYHGHSLAYAAQGYIVILPNWLGFDDPDRIHPYFVAELQAHVLLDAARAVYDFFDSAWADEVLAQPGKAVFFMGYSSGGHAVFAAKDLAASYAPELPVKGIIGHGPTTDVETLLREDPVFAPYIVYAYRDFYGSRVIDPADVFLPQWVGTFDSDVLTKCVDDIFVYYSRSARSMYLPEFRDLLYNNRLAEAFPLFVEKLKDNSTGVSGGRRIPVLILQGTGDTVVTPPSQKKFMDQMCAMGTPVTYLEYPAVPHVQIRWTSFGDTLSWMQHIVQGGAVESDCVDSFLQPAQDEGLEP